VRTLQPLDRGTILRSVRKTGRVIVSDESPDQGGVNGGLAAIVADEAFDALRAPVKRVGVVPVPISYSQPYEEAVIPSVARIVDAARALAR
jgi:pyruvate dehydrogenase E1 component beta subunit